LNPLKQLAGQTAIYGMGTIVPRLLNYLLVPIYTYLLLTEEYGIVTELYAYIAFFLVLLLYGMETTFFRYAEERKNPEKVFSTTLVSVFTTSALFFILVWSLLGPIAGWLNYSHHQDFILMAAGIVAIDAFTAIQFAYLRQQKKPIRFSIIKIAIVSVNVGLNLYYIWFCGSVYETDPQSPWLVFYDPEYRVGYIFLSNLVASLVGVVLLLPQLLRTRLRLDVPMLRTMLVYALPLLIVGVTGMVNEVVDKILFKYLAPVPEGVEDANRYVMGQLGIYGANYKLAVLMTLFIQMFRYAAEPFFFAQARESNAREIYASVMKYFVLSGLLIFLMVTLFIDVFKYFIGPEHWAGLFIVPIVLLANLFLGIFYNLSVWYKLNDLTRYGALIAVGGSLITLLVNFLAVPRFSYLGAAWGHLLCYFFMMVVSYFWGRKHYPVPYELKRIGFYFLVAMVLFAAGTLVPVGSYLGSMVFRLVLFLAFLGVVVLFEPQVIKSIRRT
jgi:O-antigen/teichoic acid export membrane protein